MKIVFILLLSIFTLPALVYAQDSLQQKKFSFSLFADIYYQLDLTQKSPSYRPDFLYNHKHQGRPSINLAIAKATYSNNRLQVNIGLMAGDYVRYNLASEPAVLKQLYEANIVWHATPKVSVEAGILPSHIGFESAISKDAYTISRSLIAENSPYYETGAKLNVALHPKWKASILLLNGWQRISNNNRSLAYGTQIQFSPNKKWLLNSSSFVGNEQNSNQPKQMRWFHNLYVTYAASPTWNLTYMLDAGIQRQQPWWGTALVSQYKPHLKWALAARAEYYSDPDGVIVSHYLPKKFRAAGSSVNVDFRPLSWAMLRTEWRYLHLANNASLYNGLTASSSFSWLLSACIWW